MLQRVTGVEILVQRITVSITICDKLCIHYSTGLELAFEQRKVNTFPLNEFRVLALLDNSAVFNHINTVGTADG